MKTRKTIALLIETGCRYKYPQVTDLAELISRNGHKVVVLAPYDPDVTRWNAGRGFEFADFHSKLPWFPRIRNVEYILRSVLAIIRSDLLISFSTPTLVSSLIGTIVFRKKSIYYALELLIPGEDCSGFYSYFQYFIRFTKMKVFSTGRHRSEIMSSAFGLSDAPGCISCAALAKTSAMINSAKGWIPSQLRRLSKNNNAIIVICDGGLSPVNYFDTLLNAKIPASSGVIIGVFGPLDPAMKPLLELTQMETSNYFYLGELEGNRYDIIEAMRGADLGIVLKRGGESSIRNDQFYTPNKLYDFFAAGIPVLCSSQPSLKFVAENSFGYTLSEVTTANLAQFLTTLPDKKEELVNMASLIKKRHLIDLNFETAAVPLLNVI